MIPRRKSGTRKWITILVLLVLIGAVIFYFANRNPKVYESVKANTADITTYTSFSGNIEARNRQPIIAETVMQVSDIFVTEGQSVKAGDILLKTTNGNEILADIDGEAANVNVEENEVIMAGTKMMDIVDYSKLQINVRVDEYDIGSLQKGKEATVKIGALQKELKGKISKISKEGVVMNGLTYFTATIDLAGAEQLRVGMSAEVKLINKTVKGVVTIPMSVIEFDNNNTPYVLKEGREGKPLRTEIETGINNGTIVEVKKGISDGETILYTNPDNQTNMGFRRPGSANNRTGGGSD